MQPIKTIVGPTGRTPIKTMTQRTDSTPRKTLVGSTARPPIKTTVGSLAAPPRKTVVGNLGAPPPKVTPANRNGSNSGPRPAAVVHPGFAGPNTAANPSFASRSLGRGDGNLGRSVAPMPPPASGPPNPVMEWNKPQGQSAIVAGGMGQTIPNMRPKRTRRSAGGGSAFYGE